MPLREVAGLGFFLFCLSAAADDAVVRAFDKSWAAAREHVYPAKLSERFDDASYRRLREKAATATSLDAFADDFNAFLDTLGRSHTRFVVANDPDYAFFHSLFGTHSVDRPAGWHLGAQLLRGKEGWLVRAVLDGGPAQKAGLRRGDLLLEADGKPFHPTRSLRGRRSVRVLFRRGEKSEEALLPVVAKNPHRSFVDATRASARVIARSAKKIGYVHLWTGTDDENLKAFHEAVATATRGVDALVLDLRDGFGGAWWPYLDDFFADSSKYFAATFVDRSGAKREVRAPVESHRHWYRGPLVVLVNEGTRSGKEALAQFFRTSGRATLVGTRTAGAVCSGRMFFAETDLGYLLYLSAGGVSIDGEDLEGKGVEPHRTVAYPLDNAHDSDPQLEAALRTAEAL